jgi:Kae1-associated kinase Bud32
LEVDTELIKVLEEFLNEKVVIAYASGFEEKKLLRGLEFLSMGAEAIIAKCLFLDIDAVIKWRFPKPYMPAELDREFRRNRTITEAKALIKALSLGINVPIPLYTEPDEGLLIMTYIDGFVLRDIIDRISLDKVCEICRNVGVYTAKLHENSIVHGDVTTSNVMLDKVTGKIYLIDFGLTNFVKRIEDQAIDVHIFFRSIESAHHNVEDIAKKCFIEGYRSVKGSYTDKVLRIVDNIRKMGRYVAERKIKSVWVMR